MFSSILPQSKAAFSSFLLFFVVFFKGYSSLCGCERSLSVIPPLCHTSSLCAVPQSPPPLPTSCSSLSPSPPQRRLLLHGRVFPCLLSSPPLNRGFLFSAADRSDTSCALTLSLLSLALSHSSFSPPLTPSHPPSAVPFLTQFHFFTHCAAPTAPHMLLSNSTALIHILDTVLIPLIILLD